MSKMWQCFLATVPEHKNHPSPKQEQIKSMLKSAATQLKRDCKASSFRPNMNLDVGHMVCEGKGRFDTSLSFKASLPKPHNSHLSKPHLLQAQGRIPPLLPHWLDQSADLGRHKWTSCESQAWPPSWGQRTLLLWASKPPAPRQVAAKIAHCIVYRNVDENRALSSNSLHSDCYLSPFCHAGRFYQWYVYTENLCWSSQRYLRRVCGAFRQLHTQSLLKILVQQIHSLSWKRSW